MMNAPHPDLTIARLRHALTEQLLPGDFAAMGEAVLDHLTKPTQITAIGRPGAGKTSLLNMILGTPDLPDLPNLRIVELTFGPSPRFKVETTAAAPETHDGIANAELLPEDAIRVIQEMPREALRNRCFAEANLPQDPAALQEVLDWLAETTDITLWCTQKFDSLEAAVWAKAPQALKDHSFLVLTKADQLQMKNALKAETERFEQTLADDFLELCPLATKQAAAARATGAVTNPELWVASGGKALLNRLAQQVGSGQAADLDYAEMLLAQVADRMPDVLPEPVSKMSPERSEQEAASASEPHVSDLEPMNKGEALDTALRILQDCAEDMGAPQANAKPPEPETILTHSAQAAQALATLLMDVNADDEPLSALRDGVMESEQLIMLLQLEGTEAAAGDAVTTLLQLKKNVAEVAFA